MKPRHVNHLGHHLSDEESRSTRLRLFGAEKHSSLHATATDPATLRYVALPKLYVALGGRKQSHVFI